MNGAPRTASTLAPWERLQKELPGRFRARARGLLGAGFSLLGPGGEEAGRLRMRGPLGAEFRAAGSESVIERSGPFAARYRMVTDGASVLLANPANPERGLRIFCGGKTYESVSNLLRNTSTAVRLPEGTGTVGVRGGLAGRGYEAEFPRGDAVALAVAVFLLYRSVALRREAF